MIRNVFGGLAALGIGLWLGILLSTVVFVIRFFHYDRDFAFQAAPLVFKYSEQMQIIVGLTTLALSLAWRLVSPSRARQVVLYVLLVACGLTWLQTQRITPRINELRDRGLAKSDEFKRYHGMSNGVYLGIFASVLAAGVACYVGISGPSRVKTAQEAPVA